jgi:hypothetical protein
VRFAGRYWQRHRRLARPQWPTLRGPAPDKTVGASDYDVIGKRSWIHRNKNFWAASGSVRGISSKMVQSLTLSGCSLGASPTQDGYD